jgi:predicted  nucleic acid-binding Zn ribbon protein
MTEELESDIRKGKEILLFSVASRMAPGTTTFKQVPGAEGQSSWDVKLITHLHPVLKLKSGGAIPPIPHTSCHHA